MSPERLEETLEHLFHGMLNQFLRKKNEFVSRLKLKLKSRAYWRHKLSSSAV